MKKKCVAYHAGKKSSAWLHVVSECNIVLYQTFNIETSVKNDHTQFLIYSNKNLYFECMGSRNQINNKKF